MKSYKINIRRQDFYEMVWDVVRMIPSGRVTTYGHIAEYLGTKRAARMVGYAMNASHSQPTIPAHRVVNRKGMLTGKHHFGSPDQMKKLLEAEGVQVLNDQVVGFDKLLWIPSKELL
ncbi:MGMT family protein [Schleiferia thermophila]|uniref:Methylated-DNA-protein-cysteine methyltransferase-like protein n=1 Tax=Schleiferia thermophila TaxID=884107 RepID=A0A369A9X8_9FLAO|nr:methylated-DNA--protein-cysteine methyltransferase [Schleiferia thermophila str. Yellowstone]RCX05198.1 methylated-DNA-protein-cysteine methyltransferase-like protein [Schleiferia thermophila]